MVISNSQTFKKNIATLVCFKNALNKEIWASLL